jgi:hypothetical protein
MAIAEKNYLVSLINSKRRWKSEVTTNFHNVKWAGCFDNKKKTFASVYYIQSREPNIGFYILNLLQYLILLGQ